MPVEVYVSDNRAAADRLQHWLRFPAIGYLQPRDVA